MVYYPTLIASSMGIGATFSPPPATMISLLLPPTTRNHPGSISTMYGILSYLDCLLYGNRRNILSASCNNDLLAPAPHHQEAVLIVLSEVTRMDPSLLIYQLLEYISNEWSFEI
jgi:hypothetical protein